MEEMKRSKFYNYPQPEEGPKTSWAFKPGTNPVVKGVPLLAVASLWVPHLIPSIPLPLNPHT